MRTGIKHQVAIPPGYAYQPLSQHVPPEKPFRVYPFTLDPFQRTSISCIERNESVLVSAHTSAGKTVVAEYAIAQALASKQRVIYTSPIKALSNQKFRDLGDVFGDVGLMTGDVTINEKASCLVMTTEILRSMLYRGSEIMREVSWVIFDEIHYMRDLERGVVWEETLILLSHSVRYVFLSATIPNAFQFASWIAATHSQPCHVVYTDYRPTPLQHYIFTAGGSGMHLVVDENGQFREDSFGRAMGSLGPESREALDGSAGGGAGGKKGKKGKGGTKGPSDIYKIVKMIMMKNYQPVIIFAFSKRETEALAMQMTKFEFNTPEEQDQVKEIFDNAIASLSEEDKELSAIASILPLLKKGVGIHHGGLLPILKEVIEILFGEGLLKVLFATETFSIGLNMPAKTVVFTNVRKFDGKDFRTLSSGEYIQMSGRAGRRGKDDRGIVIMMVDDKLEPAAAKSMVKGEADRLDSAFHLGYNMVLNLMRVEGVSPEYMLEKCFYQYQSAEKLPEIDNEIAQLKVQVNAIKFEDEDTIADYYELRKQLDILKEDFRDCCNHPTYSLPFLQIGRLVRVKYEDADFGWGVVVTYKKRLTKGLKDDDTSVPDTHKFIVDVLLLVSSSSSINPKSHASTALEAGIRPPSPNEQGEFAVVPVLLSLLDGISLVRLNLPDELKTPAKRQQVKKTLDTVLGKFGGPETVPLLDPVKNMNIEGKTFTDLLKKIDALEGRLRGNKLHKDPHLAEQYSKYAEKMALQEKIKQLKKKMTGTKSVLHLDELKNRKKVLRRLGFVTKDGVVEQKGRVACEISSGDELLLTEMIFNSVFNDLSPEQCAALLSCFVFSEKSEKIPSLKEELSGPLRIMQEMARRIAQTQKECRMEIDEQEYVDSFKVGLMDVVFQWCKGANFAEVSQATDVFEGSLIRAFRRLQELLRQMSMAAKAIGNEELENKFQASLTCLERKNSVVFNPSLYL
ncbi:antiviral helicase [Atractiella rhizophila]|nr:antiviral helicase [Atractiella rhizophila]